MEQNLVSGSVLNDGAIGFTCAGLALLSFLLLLWQWAVAMRFPLHRRISDPGFQPAVTLLKPLKGCDEFTEQCLGSWLRQEYRGDTQVLFGVASASDPVCEVVGRVITNHPGRDAQLVICGPPNGANAKVSQLARLGELAQHEIVLISDADVHVPPDFLVNAVSGVRDQQVGLVNCFYELANPSTTAMQWEAVAINAEFWSQVLQARSLKPLDFAMGAVMITRRKQLAEIGGFAALIDCLADDYQLANRLVKSGYRVELCTVPVECWSAPMGWRDVWKHQLRWARTIRVCQPWQYFFSILGNPTLWPLIWLLVKPGPLSLGAFASIVFARLIITENLVRRIEGRRSAGLEDKRSAHSRRAGRLPTRVWMAPIKDLLQAAIWLGAFLGNQIEWRGQRMRLRSDGTLVRAADVSKHVEGGL